MPQTKFSSLAREQLIKQFSDVEFDVIIIGGGITGSGIALDATTRGMTVALVEMQDFASGTSSRSTKLVHGGLRYLKQFEVGLVAEVGKERAIVYENGPHVTTPEWMLLPLYKGGTFGKFTTSIGLRVYDFLAGVKKSERRTMLSVHETLSKEPLVKKEELKGAGYYVEYRTDDARLTIEVLKEAVNRGATAINYSKVTELIYADGKIVGVEVTDGLNGTTYKIFAKKVINATGPWVDTLREKDRSKKGKNLRLTKGVHLVFDQSKFPLKQSVYFDTPDGRMVFAIPRDGKTYVGTTDTFFDKDIKSPKITSEDRQYIIKCVNYMFPSVSLKESDIESSWAGVRPLIYEEGKDPSEISRKDEIWQSQTGMITIAGGKLTGYRKMAETVVDLLVNLFEEESGRSFKTCQTKTLPISGGAVGGASNFNDFIHQYEHKALELGLTKQDYMKLSRMYGSNIEVLLTLVPSYTEETSYGLPIILFLQLMYGIQHEMICKPVDFFIRRTGALFFDINTVIQSKDKVISCMSDKLGWTEEQRDEYTKELEEQLFNAINPTEET